MPSIVERMDAGMGWANSGALNFAHPCFGSRIVASLGWPLGAMYRALGAG